MNCPVCDAKLREVHKHGVDVDICPDCKGVWLDRGELEKILQMVRNDDLVSDIETGRIPGTRRSSDTLQTESRKYETWDNRGEYGSKRRGRRGSWLSEIFESFGGDD